MNEAQPTILSAAPTRTAAAPLRLDTTGAHVVPVVLDEPKTYHLPGWGTMSDPDRMAFLRSVVKQRGRDPRMRELAFRIILGTGQRDYPAQAAKLLKWTQESINYVNEPGEILQDPLYTLKIAAGDCDDMGIFLATLFEAVRLPWRFVLSGANRVTKQRVRWVEGTPYPRGVTWGHIYTCVGWPVFKPTTWRWAEPTIKNAPLGWDVTSHRERTGNGVLPELAGETFSGAPASAGVPAAGAGAVAGSSQRSIIETVVISVATMVLATATIDYLRTRGVIPTPT